MEVFLRSYDFRNSPKFLGIKIAPESQRLRFIGYLETLLGLKSWLRESPFFFGVQSLEKGQKYGNQKKYYKC